METKDKNNEEELIILNETYYGSKNKTTEQIIRTFLSCILIFKYSLI
jgi:hypothetical protein